jgi:hypothetical protein
LWILASCAGLIQRQNEQRTPFLHQQQSLTIKLSKTPVFSGIYGCSLQYQKFNQNNENKLLPLLLKRLKVVIDADS